MVKITKHFFEEAVKGSAGSLTLIARRLNCTRRAVEKYLKKYPIQPFLNSEIESFLDIAENKLKEAVLNGQPWAIKYYLSTKGKSRGYGPENGTSINILKEPIIVSWREEISKALKKNEEIWNSEPKEESHLPITN